MSTSFCRLFSIKRLLRCETSIEGVTYFCNVKLSILQMWNDNLCLHILDVEILGDEIFILQFHKHVMYFGMLDQDLQTEKHLSINELLRFERIETRGVLLCHCKCVSSLWLAQNDILKVVFCMDLVDSNECFKREVICG